MRKLLALLLVFGLVTFTTNIVSAQDTTAQSTTDTNAVQETTTAPAEEVAPLS
ncbi:MAG: hypothetical protein IPM82_22210 [Saprospiraceae bacterium]|nr:hypothetical protein [Saprospiraceae bacterium]